MQGSPFHWLTQGAAGGSVGVVEAYAGVAGAGCVNHQPQLSCLVLRRLPGWKCDASVRSTVFSILVHVEVFVRAIIAHVSHMCDGRGAGRWWWVLLHKFIFVRACVHQQVPVH